jgi:hypothetical protein
VNHKLHPSLDRASGQRWVQNQEVHTTNIHSSLEAEPYESVANEMVEADFSLSIFAGNNAFTNYKFSPLATRPTMLYRLLKKVYQSSRTCFSLSSKSSHSGRQSSSLSELFARARDESLPVNTAWVVN